MSTFSENKDSSKDLLNTSWEIWKFLKEKAGLDIKNYDMHIVEELCNGLSIPLPCEDVEMELRRQNISPELFIGTFLRAIQPYAQMMSDLCVFFYLHGVKRTNKEMKILFDFGKGPEDLGFDLKHFREIILKYRRISQNVTIYGWNLNTLWGLAGIFRDFWRYNPQDPRTKDWLLNYGGKGGFSSLLPSLPTAEIEGIDLWLQRVWHVWATIILECKKYGSSRDDLRKHAKAEQERAFRGLPEEEREESYESLRHFKQLPDFKDWDIDTLFHLDHGLWPESMLRGLIGFTEKLLKTPKHRRAEIAQPTLGQIQRLFSSLYHREVEKEVLIKEFLELLNLPVWNRRHELYQTWVLTQIDKALENYKRTIHHVNGALILKFSGTHIASLETEKGRIHIWSELRSPLANPVGRGRKGHIQPDYTLTFEPISSPLQTVVAIECKQYRKANPKNFADALIDYAKGCPNAKVLLVNYGEIPKKILDRIDNALKAQTVTFGNFRPDKLRETELFRQLLIKSLPKPVGKKEVGVAIKEMYFDLIAVDISGSMENSLDEERVLKILEMIIYLSPSSKLVAIDTTVKKKWAKAENGVKELLSLPRDGGTNLPGALSTYDLGKCVIITDNDGWEQLSTTVNPPYLVIEVGTEKTLYFHFRN